MIFHLLGVLLDPSYERLLFKQTTIDNNYVLKINQILYWSFADLYSWPRISLLI